MTKKVWSRSRLFTKRMISGYAPLMPASMDIYAKSAPAGPCVYWTLESRTPDFT
jgi:hypothetical protein